MTFTIEQASRLYRVPLVDYGRPSTGVLVSSGCGIMMGVMDACPELRWCVDIDDLKRRPEARIADFLLMAERACEVVAVCGWFSLTDPTCLREAVAALEAPVTYGGGGVWLKQGEPKTLGAFIEAVQARAEAVSPRRAKACP